MHHDPVARWRGVAALVISVILGVVAAPAPAPAAEAPEQLWVPQLDHVMFPVLDLEAAVRTLEGMGFRMGPKVRIPNGIENRIVAFRNQSYLEPLSVWDPSRAFPELNEFLEETEGGFSLALRVDSVERTAARLRDRGLPVADPAGRRPAEPGQPAPPSFFEYVAFTERVVPNRLFFITYDEEARQRIVDGMPAEQRSFTEHPNGALALRAVWVGVENVAEAAVLYADLGLAVEPVVPIPSLGAIGSCVRAGDGCILLLEGAGGDGIVGELLAEHGPGSILGVTISVEDLERASSFLTWGEGGGPEPYDGLFGRSVRIPAARMYGLEIELAEAP